MITTQIVSNYIHGVGRADAHRHAPVNNEKSIFLEDGKAMVF